MTSLTDTLSPGSLSLQQVGWLEAGHQIRVAVAGHDAGAFERIPAGGEPVITLQRNPDFASHIDLPLVGKGG